MGKQNNDNDCGGKCQEAQRPEVPLKGIEPTTPLRQASEFRRVRCVGVASLLHHAESHMCDEILVAYLGEDLNRYCTKETDDSYAKHYGSQRGSANGGPRPFGGQEDRGAADCVGQKPHSHGASTVDEERMYFLAIENLVLSFQLAIGLLLLCLVGHVAGNYRRRTHT